MRHEELRGLLEAYALGALDTDEEAEVKSHLVGCQECQSLVQEYQEVLGLLPHALAAASPLQPNPTAKEHLLQAIREGQFAPSDMHLPEAPQRPQPPRLLRRWPWMPQPRLVATSLVVLLLALAISLVWGLQMTTALARERTLRTELAALVGQQETVLEIVDSNRAVKRILRATEPGSPSYGKLYSRPDLPQIVAMVGRLAQSPEGQVYLLWVVENGRTSLAGALTPNAQGFALLVFNASHSGPVYEAAWVTLQPSGTTTPSDSIVLRWDIPR